MDDEIEYTTEMVRVLRINESKTIAQREADGWEFVSQRPLTLRTEMTFRRPKRKLPKGLVIAASVGAAAIFIAIVALGITSESEEPAEPAAEESLPTVSEPSETPSQPSATATATAEALESVITPDNHAPLRALLELGDYCDPSIEDFAEDFAGDTISFPANIAAITPHGSATTRYDILMGSGDYSETTARGPAFQFRDVNTTSDLNYAGALPDSVGTGTNLSITAKVDAYEPDSCLLLLAPVSTSIR
ncbi:DUF4839 domain-containing protein [Rhodoglobus sp. NPDC076762]